MSTPEDAKPAPVPQRVYDWYNAHYNNVTYRAFRDALVESSHYGPLSETKTDEQFIDTAMNLLIDASFERSGAECYRGAEAELIAHINPLDSRLATLSRLHLSHFGGAPPEEAEQMLINARQLAETAAQKASDIRSWRGRVAYSWATAAMFLLHAAAIVINEDHAASYTLEKLDRALDHLQIGVLEAQQRESDFTLTDTFIAWIRALVKTQPSSSHD